MTAFVFSSDQPLTTQGSTISSNVADTGAVGGPVLEGQRFVIKTGSVTGLSFPSQSLFQIVIQDSANGSSWADNLALCPQLAVKALAAGETVVTMRVPAGLRRYVRLVYRIVGATPSGSISATVEALAPDRFGYGASAIPGIAWGPAA